MENITLLDGFLTLTYYDLIWLYYVFWFSFR